MVSLEQRFKDFSDKVSSKLNQLKNDLGEVIPWKGLSPNNGQSLTTDVDGKVYYKERTPEEIASAYESLTDRNRFSDAHKATVESFEGQFLSLEGKMDSGNYEGTGADLYALISEIQVPEIVDTLNSTFTDKTLSANQGRILYGFIQDINTILNGDDASLDQIKEISNYIKQNRDDLQSLSVSNIAGLESDLAGKEPVFSKNTGFNRPFGTGSNDVARGNHTHAALAEIPDIITAADNLADTVAEAELDILELKSRMTDAETDIEAKLDKTAKIQAVWIGTQAEYDAISTPNATTLYFIQ